MTTGWSYALEMPAVLCDIDPEDEAIVPLYPFVFAPIALCSGAKIDIVDFKKIVPEYVNLKLKN